MEPLTLFIAALMINSQMSSQKGCQTISLKDLEMLSVCEVQSKKSVLKPVTLILLTWL